MRTSITTDPRPHAVNLVVGDWSDDGHGKTETVMIMSNFDQKQIRAAYKKGVKTLGLDVAEHVCEDYEDSILSLKDYKTLSDKGFIFSKEIKKIVEKKNDEIYVDTDLFVKMYLFVVKLGEPTFEYEIPKPLQCVEIGGYGLFT
jgi:hypothetical protein